MVTTTSIRSALSKIVRAQCGTPAGLVRVVVPSSQEPSVYVVALPSEYAPEVYQYLSEELGITIPLGADPLVLTAREAASLVSLARELPALRGANETAS